MSAKFPHHGTKCRQVGLFEFRSRGAELLQQANEMIMRDILPGVPYAHSIPALGMQKTVSGYIASPIGTDPFAPVNVGGQ